MASFHVISQLERERERKRDDCFVFDVDILMAKMPNTKLNDKAFR